VYATFPREGEYNEGMRAIALPLVSIALWAQDPAKGVNFYSLEKERALGEQLAKEYRAQATLIEQAELRGRIEALSRSLVPFDSRFTYSFELTASDDTLLQEPATFPGGFVFIPSGLILAAQNIDEVAGMIAHSIAHIEARHGTKRATKTQLAEQATVPLIYMGGWTGYAIRQNMALSIPLGMLKFVRTQELDADLIAARLMSAAGFQPARLAEYVERMQPADPATPDARSPLPSRADRVAALRALPQPAVSPNSSINLTELQDLLRQALPVKAKVPPSLGR
jgi:predicted Zn-dependent protease